MNNKSALFQKWLPFKTITKNGIIILKDETYIKIIRVFPINYNLKSELEKNAILNAYKIFLKTCDFEMQVLVQSSKEDLSEHLLKIEKESTKEENVYLKNFYPKYISFIKEKNQKKQASNKKFFILIKNNSKNISLENVQNILNDNYYKIKECLSRSGNVVTECNNRDEIVQLLSYFFNYRKNNIGSQSIYEAKLLMKDNEHKKA
ncbi:MAG: hypothetical protein FWF46_07800 [Oscillospiraceae bacterium]|nr:hypothetical protein [Oscillospiraceae bacterium]